MVKKKKNGYVLAETLIVSVFIMVMFTIFYSNILPLVGEYSRREAYNDIDSIYRSHWVRKLVLLDYSNLISKYTDTTGYVDMSDCRVFSPTYTNQCQLMKNNFGITRMYLIRYNTTIFKEKAKKMFDPTNDSSILEYVSYLPTYQGYDKDNNSYYRVIIERTESANGETKKYYGTIEVHA